jgi:hypothetical protein
MFPKRSVMCARLIAKAGAGGKKTGAGIPTCPRELRFDEPYGKHRRQINNRSSHTPFVHR